MITAEWNLEDALKVRGKEGRQEGLQKGALEVIAMLEKGYSLTDAKKMLKLA